MSKKRKIKKLEARIAELEYALAKREKQVPAKQMPKPAIKQSKTKKKAPKTSVNVFLDSNFVKSLAESGDERISRAERRAIAYENRQRRKDVARYRSGHKGGSKLWKLIKFLFRTILVLVIIALIAAVLGAIVMGITWALVNFNVVPVSQPVVAFIWRALTYLFGLLGRPVPMI